MARRYSGALTVELYYRPHVRLGCIGQDWYYCRVTMGRKVDVMSVHAPATGFGPGVAYDSPEAYDRIARAAIGLADPALSDYAEWMELGEPQASGRAIEWTDVRIRRRKPIKDSSHKKESCRESGSSPKGSV